MAPSCWKRSKFFSLHSETATDSKPVETVAHTVTTTVSPPSAILPYFSRATLCTPTQDVTTCGRSWRHGKKTAQLPSQSCRKWRCFCFIAKRDVFWVDFPEYWSFRVVSLWAKSVVKKSYSRQGQWQCYNQLDERVIFEYFLLKVWMIAR